MARKSGSGRVCCVRANDDAAAEIEQAFSDRFLADACVELDSTWRELSFSRDILALSREKSDSRIDMLLSHFLSWPLSSRRLKC